jgi:hypothetical protein
MLTSDHVSRAERFDAEVFAFGDLCARSARNGIRTWANRPKGTSAARPSPGRRAELSVRPGGNVNAPGRAPQRTRLAARKTQTSLQRPPPPLLPSIRRIPDGGELGVLRHGARPDASIRGSPSSHVAVIATLCPMRARRHWGLPWVLPRLPLSARRKRPFRPREGCQRSTRRAGQRNQSRSNSFRRSGASKGIQWLAPSICS